MLAFVLAGECCITPFLLQNERENKFGRRAAYYNAMWWSKANEQWNQWISAHLCRKGQTVSEPSCLRIGILSPAVTRTLLKTWQPPKRWCEKVRWCKAGVKSEHTTPRNRFESWSTRFFSLPKCCLLWSLRGERWFKWSLLKPSLLGRCVDISET